MNVVLVVADTLREDFSQGLEELTSRGFSRYQGAVAAAPWTLPSHVSMFTGQLPSEHGVHESEGVYNRHMGEFAERIRASPHNILNLLKSRGYQTYCLTENPLLSPYFGFDFDVYREYDDSGETSGLNELLSSGRSSASKALFLLRRRKLSTLARLTATSLRRRSNTALRRESLDKGSQHLIESLESTELNGPFFAFVNVMDAHEPYNFAEAKSVSDVLPLSILGRPSAAVRWKRTYGLHSSIAVKCVLDIVDLFGGDDTLTIVTSDHGQLLGEKNRYGHGYYLADELLRVPLYVRYPSGVDPFPQTRPLISLTEISKIVAAATTSGHVELGSDSVLAESFGSQNDLSRFTTDRDIVDSVYARRVGVFSERGTVVYNASTKAVEENEQRLSEEEVRRMIGLVKPVEQPIPSPLPSKEPKTLTGEDEELVSNRLRALGYV